MRFADVLGWLILISIMMSMIVGASTYLADSVRKDKEQNLALYVKCMQDTKQESRICNKLVGVQND